MDRLDDALNRERQARLAATAEQERRRLKSAAEEAAVLARGQADLASFVDGMRRHHVPTVTIHSLDRVEVGWRKRRIEWVEGQPIADGWWIGYELFVSDRAELWECSHAPRLLPASTVVAQESKMFNEPGGYGFSPQVLVRELLVAQLLNHENA